MPQGGAKGEGHAAVCTAMELERAKAFGYCPDRVRKKMGGHVSPPYYLKVLVLFGYCFIPAIILATWNLVGRLIN